MDQQLPADATDFGWLIAARGRNQGTLNDLYHFLCENTQRLEQDLAGRRAFSWLIGAAFSLWRGAFLADTNRSPSAILAGARKLLERLLRDNAVAYPQDRDTRDWMVGYYLNNARWRLIEAREALKAQGRLRAGGQALQRINALDQLDVLENPSEECWDSLDTVVRDLLDLLKNE